MYDRDMPAIRAHALASPDGLMDVITFTLLTIQQPFASMRDQVADVRKRGARSRFLFGSKRKGYRYALAHKAELYAAACAAVRTNDTEAAIAAFLKVPGLGIPKASFVAQMLGLNAACLDRHNLRALGKPETGIKSVNSLKPETQRKKIAEYLDTCSIKTPRKWWDEWCDFVAAKGGLNKRLPTGDAVSKFHLEAMGLAA